MLINFCRKCLGSSVICSTVSNDGYEVTNLTSDNDRGFLAYSCIKPPVHIDFNLICDIQINHILIWPSVGAQKSSGFEIAIKSGNDYKRVTTGYLSSEHSGLLFYRRDVGRSTFEAPPSFLHRYMQLSHDQSLNRVNNLRISILKTENSVPAIGRVEIWGKVSAFSGKEAIALVHSLWKSNGGQRAKVESIDDATSTKNIPETARDSGEKERSVPDCFLDPITCHIMIQPIVLPSGAIIDQSTLEKHGKNEATWGRSLSDPFTGIPFNDSRKPIIASALKARIDRYLLENKHAPDVKSMPRLSGHKQVVMSMRNRTLEISEIMPHSNTVWSASSNRQSPKNDKSTKQLLEKLTKLPAQKALQAKIQDETRAHRLPIIPMSSKRGVDKIGTKTMRIKSFGISAFRKEIRATEKKVCKESNLDLNVKTVLSNLQRFDKDNRVKSPKCLKNCPCSSKIFYKLPCNHILCRDVVMSIKDSRCLSCSSEYNSRDLERIHGNLGIG